MPIPGLIMPPALYTGKSPEPPFITFKASATSSASKTCSIPSSVVAGDIIVFFDFNKHDGTVVGNAVPSGFTQLISSGVAYWNDDNHSARTTISYKLANGSEGGLSVTSNNDAGTDANTRKAVLVFGANATTLASGGTGQSATNGTPSNITVAAGSQTAPLLIVAGYRSQGSVTSRGMSPDKTGEVAAGSGGIAYAAYRIVNSSPANVTLSMGDYGNGNILCGGFIRVAS